MAIHIAQITSIDLIFLMTQMNVCTGICAQDRTVSVSCVFDKLTYWNLETPPNSDDRVVMAMDWPELAEAVSLFFPN